MTVDYQICRNLLVDSPEGKNLAIYSDVPSE